MTLHSAFLLIFLSAALASCHLLTAQRAARELKESVREQRRIGQTRLQDRQPRSVSTLKVLDFSADKDHEPDINGEYTGATLEAGPLPESFTICSAFMVEAWTTEFSSAYMFALLNDYALLLGHWYEIMALYYVKSILTEISASRQDRRVLQKSKIIRIKFLSI